MTRKHLMVGAAALGLALGPVLLVAPGCTGGNDFLNLEDYQRDLLIGGLAAVLLNQAPTGDGGAGATAGRDGTDGLNCWDLNADGTEDPEEDINGDGRWDARDCRGADGADGTSGTGGNGLGCWDLNGNSIGDPGEDSNNDGILDARDCQGADGDDGPAGNSGSRGSDGLAGPDGPQFFDIFIDDLFERGAVDTASASSASGQLLVSAILIDEPVLTAGGTNPIAYRVAIPPSYTEGNDVTMRVFFYRTGLTEEDCVVLTLDSRRLRHGSGVEVYGDDCSQSEDPACGRRWIQLDRDPIVPGDVAGGLIGDNGVLIVVDLPLNSAAGLNLERDISEDDGLASGNFLAFELNIAESSRDTRLYQLLGVEFFESEPGTAQLAGDQVFFADEPDPCSITDCNDNGIPDYIDIAECPDDNPDCQDCNFNRLPDECDIRDCDIEDVSCQDCNGNRVPDECDICVDPPGAVAGPASQPFTFLQAGFTQELYASPSGTCAGGLDDGLSCAVSADCDAKVVGDAAGTCINLVGGFMGGVAFAPDGDVLVTSCFFNGSPLRRFDEQTTVMVHGSEVHPWIDTLDSNAGCGIVNHPDGTLYSNTTLGVTNLDPDTGAELRSPIGLPGNADGIAVDPQTGDLVYVGEDCRLDPKQCTIYAVDPVSESSRVFAILEPQFIDGISFDPEGDFLFLAKRDDSEILVLRRDGTEAQTIPVPQDLKAPFQGPDATAFHASAPRFMVSVNLDGTISRYDFPNDDFSQPPTHSVFASGGFRGDLAQVGTDGCLYLTQLQTRYADGTVTPREGNDRVNSVVRICGGFDPPMPSDITLSPGSAINLAGDEHTVIARVMRSGEPVVGDEVTFTVLAGPNVGASGNATTGDGGLASFTYVSNGTIGTDEIQASTEDETGIKVSNIALKTWWPTDCSQDCNGNGIPDECELNGNDCNENGILDECEPDVCDDGDPCTRDYCDGGCFSEPVCDKGLTCVDGQCLGCLDDSDCAEGEFCFFGVCVGD